MVDVWAELIRLTKAQGGAPTDWVQADYAKLFEFEAVLYLAERLIEPPAQRPVEDCWTLVSGYCIAGLNDSAEARRMCLSLRRRLRHLDSHAAWKTCCTWYRQLPDSLRLYDVTLQGDMGWMSAIKPYFPDFHARKAAYQALCQAFYDPDDKPALPWASAGTYQFKIRRSHGEVLEAVTLTPALANHAVKQTAKRALPTRTERVPITVTLADLLRTAEGLDQREAELGLTSRRWAERIKNLELSGAHPEAGYHLTDVLTLDGLFHLVGMLGAGKSSLIWVLTVHLAQHGRHVSVVMTTVVETLRFAQWLRQMGVRAAPVLGRKRADHARKYGMAESEALSEERLFVPKTVHPPAIDWLVAPCALSGALHDPIPPGEEPCDSLKQIVDGEEKTFRCPLKPICPVHRAAREAVDAQVWVVNPQSLLYSAAPDGVGGSATRLLEAVYRLSDVVIVDEADSVQVRWDTTFSPSDPMVGSDNAFLDWLRERLTLHSRGRKRSRAGEATFNRLTNLEDQTNILANHAYRLLQKHKGVKSWVAGRQHTPSSLSYRLAEWLVKAFVETRDKVSQKRHTDALKTEIQRLMEDDKRHSDHPLAGWVSRLLANPSGDRGLTRELRQWVMTRFNLRANHTMLGKAAHRLDMVLTLAALIRRFNRITSHEAWIEQELGRFDGGDFLPSETVCALMPTPPLDNPLGLRLIVQGTTDGGAFYLSQSRGIGRWLLLNLSRLYEDQYGWVGPHVLLTSATSWLPGSTQFNLKRPPDAILRPARPAMPDITLTYHPVMHRDKAIRISGGGSEGQKYNNLRAMVKGLAESAPGVHSLIEQELNHWVTRDPKAPRRVLLVVNSYDQSKVVLETMEAIPAFKGRVLRLVADDETITDDAPYLHTRKVESLLEYNAEVLIAPLMAIQRGFNILDEHHGALLGSVFFLVRPYPPPDDLSQHVLAVNDWLMQRLEPDGRTLHKAQTLGTLRHVRQSAMGMWRKRLQARTFNGMDDDIYAAFLRDHFVPIWQTIGRLIRGGKDARAFFVDGAFAPSDGVRHLLRDWHAMLKNLHANPDPTTVALTSALYADAIEAFDRAMTAKRLE
jgi:hypothetical protein